MQEASATVTEEFVSRNVNNAATLELDNFAQNQFEKTMAKYPKG